MTKLFKMFDVNKKLSVGYFVICNKKKLSLLHYLACQIKMQLKLDSTYSDVKKNRDREKTGFSEDRGH